MPRPRASEFVVNERVAFPARRRQAMVGPFAGGVLLVFQNSMDETVDDLAVLKPELAADQIGGRHLLVTSEKHHRPPQLGRHMKRQRCLAGTGGTAEMNRISHAQVAKRPISQILDRGGLHEIGAWTQRNCASSKLTD